MSDARRRWRDAAMWFALALVAQLLCDFAPGLKDVGPVPYSRAVNFVDAAMNIADGRGLVLDLDRVAAVHADWKAQGGRMPPSPGAYQELRSERTFEYYDERGYLLLQLGIGQVFGFGWVPAQLLQALLNGLAAIAVGACVRAFTGNAALAWLAALTVGVHPLVLLIGAWPDHPIWAVYAAVAALVLVAWPAGRTRDDLLRAAVCGLVLGVCLVQRATNIAPLAAALAGVLLAQGRRGIGIAALALAACVTVMVLVSFAPLPGPTVGRSAVWQTPLCGLAEFGDVEGLTCTDASIASYLKRHYGAEELTPEYAAGAKAEVYRLVGERPWLPLQVIGERLGWFLVAYRPGKSGLLIVTFFLAFKIALVSGAVFAWRDLPDGAARRLYVAVAGVVASTFLVHLLIVPLLEVYIAASLVLATPVAIYGVIRSIAAAARALRAG